MLAAIPRGGSTWMMELLGALKGVRMIAEPCNLRVKKIAQALRLTDWDQLVEADGVERLSEYFNDLDCGRIKFLDPNPFTQMRFVTSQTLFKVIHLPVHVSAAVAAQLDARLVVLCRHPIPVSLSRETFPLLQTFSTGSYREMFASTAQEAVDDALRSNDHLLQGVAAWCLHFGPYLEAVDKGILPNSLISYENTVAEPSSSIRQAEQLLQVSFPQSVYDRIDRPSRVLLKSDEETRQVLRGAMDGESRKNHLIARWTERVDSNQKVAVQAILDAFDIRLYRADSIFPQTTK